MAKEPQTTETDNAAFEAATVSSERKNVPSTVLAGDTHFKVKQQVNVPVLKHESGNTVVVRIEQPIRKEISRKEDEVTTSDGEVIKGIKETDISVVRVTELTSGLLFNLVLNAITASELDRAYPDNSYVGKSFAIRKLGVVAGKRYKDVQIVEIEPEVEPA